MNEWYKRKTWTKADEEEFFRKLKKTRKYNRPQYLRAQAQTLIETERKDLLDTANKLLQIILDEYPKNLSEKSLVLQSLGNISQRKGETSLALEYYRQSIEFEQMLPDTHTDSFLLYAELVVKMKQVDLYDSAERLVKTKISKLVLPTYRYKAFAILSIIYKLKGDTVQANSYASLAEENETPEAAGSWFHKLILMAKEQKERMKQLTPAKGQQIFINYQMFY